MALIFVYNSGGEVPYMLFYTVLALPVVSILYIAVGYFGLKYEQRLDSSSVIKGEKATYTLRIANRGPFILPYVNIRFYDDSEAFVQQPDIKNISIQPFSKKEFCFDYVYKYRGSFKLGVSAVEINDFLGIFKLTRRNKQPLLITVYPRIIDIGSIGLNTHYLPDQMSYPGGMYEDTSVIEEINKYNYGDSLNKVHWKLTAKTNELMVKKYQNNAAASAILIVDLYKSNFTKECNDVSEDKHIEAAVAVLRSCIYDGTAVRLVYYEKEIRIIQCNSPLDFENAYQALAKAEFNHDSSAKDIIKSQINLGINIQDILFTTSNVDSELYEILSRMKSAGYNIYLIYISPEEITREKNQGIEQILSALSSGIKVYRINISDDLNSVFGYGGRENH